MPSSPDSDLHIAARLAAAGIPVLCAYPDDSQQTGYRLPPNWQATSPSPDYLQAWKPGMAVLAVMGQGIDLVDIDPRNGGELTAELLAMLPPAVGWAVSPSGGLHIFVISMGVGSRDGILPGVDVKAGDADGHGRGFAFIAPTVRRSKVTGEPAPYRWAGEPDLSRVNGYRAEDAPLAELIRSARAGRHDSDGSGFIQPPGAGWIGERIPVGRHHDELVRYAGRLRAIGLPLAEAEALMTARLRDLEPAQPGRANYTEREALAELHDVYLRYAPGDPAAGSDDGEPDLEPYIAKKVAQLRVERAARERLTAEQAPAIPPVAGGTEFLAQPDEATSWRQRGIWPAGGNVLLAAQYKAGKTTLAGNVIRAWCDELYLLGEFPTFPPGKPILLIDTEMSPATARRWLRDLSIHQPELFEYVSLRGRAASLDVLTAPGRQRWAQIAAGCGAILLDCLGPVLGALGLDENSNTDVMRFLAGWDEMLAMAGVAESLIAHHMGHTGERSRGASRLRDWPDAEWRLIRQDENPSSPRYFAAFGRDVDIPETRLEFDPKHRSLTIVRGGGSRQRNASSAALNLITEMLTAEPWQSARRIELALGLTCGRNQIRAALVSGMTFGRLQSKPGKQNAILYAVADGGDSR